MPTLTQTENQHCVCRLGLIPPSGFVVFLIFHFPDFSTKIISCTPDTISCLKSKPNDKNQRKNTFPYRMDKQTPVIFPFSSGNYVPATNPSKILLTFFPDDSSCLFSSPIVIELRSKEKSFRHFFAKEILRLSGALPHKKKMGRWMFCRPLWECQNACLPRFPPPSTSVNEHTSVPIFRIVRWQPSLRESYASAPAKNFAAQSTQPSVLALIRCGD